MPGRRLTRRPGARRKTRRRRYRKGRPYVSRNKRFKKASQAIIRQPSGLPDRLFVRLKYSEGLTWSQAAGACAYNIYRGNSLYDPNFTGAGGQPYLFDQWAAFYNNYRVYGSKVTITSSANGGGSFNAAYVGITPSPESTSFGSSGQNLLLENPYTRKRLLKMGAAAVGQNFIKHYMSTRKIYGLDKRQASDRDYSANTSSDPSQTWFWHIWTFTPDTNTIAMDSRVVITYYVEFFSRTRPALS